MEIYDVIIIGAGPAGSTCARFLDKDIKLLWLDKKQFPRDKLCGGWITPETFKILELDYPNKITFNKTKLHYLNKIYTDINPQHSYGVIRKEFDNFLIKKTNKKITIENVIEINFKTDLVELTTNKNKYLTKFIVGAAGTFCPLNKLVTKKANPKNKAICLELELKGTAPQYPELFIENDLNGYSWYVGKNNYINIGIGRINEKNIFKHLKLFLNKINIKINPNKFKGYFYYLYDKNKKIVGKNWILTGDSAGLAKPISAEGIKPAIFSGKYAAKVLNDYFKNGTKITKYKKLINNHYNHTNIKIPFKKTVINVIIKNKYLRNKIILKKIFGIKIK